MQNDRVAQKALYQEHKDRLMSIVYRYIKDIEISKDVLQETFVKIFTSLGNFDSNKGQFKSWSARIAVNEALQHLRRKKIINTEIHENLILEDKDLLTSMTVEEIKMTIDKMSETDRVILNLFYFDEYDHEEISKMLGIKRSSSRSQLARARKHLIMTWKKINAVPTL